MALSHWTPFTLNQCYGVVKSNFEIPGGHAMVLPVQLGEPLLIKGEYGEWFYVRRLESDAEGIVPKNYIFLKSCSIIRNGDQEIVVPTLPPLVHDVNSALREWYRITKQLFIVCSAKRGSKNDDASEKFITIRKLIFELHNCRKLLLSSNLTVEGHKELKIQVASLIDFGNNLLKLDLVVRDDDGNPLEPLATSTIQLFRKHHRASLQQRRSAQGSQRSSRVFSHNSYSLLVTITHIKWRIVDECELRFFLCDFNSSAEDGIQPFTESVQINLKAGSPFKMPFKFLFTDLGKSDFEKVKQVYLVVYVTRIGPMEYKEPELKREHTPFADKRNNIQVKRPYLVAAKEITSVFDDENLKQLQNDLETQTAHYMLCIGEESMEDTLRKLVGIMNNKNEHNNSTQVNGKETRPNLTFEARFQILPGTSNQISEETPGVVRGNPIVARKMGFPEVILANDVRNNLYIRLVRGEFHRGGAKTTEKNVEVSVSVHNERGVLLQGILSGGEGTAPQDIYKSLVYYHNDKPKWNEYFKISLPRENEHFSTAHIKFTFKHRSSSESKDRGERPFALSYLKLKENAGTAIKDAQYELIVYKVDGKHYRESEVQYLTLPYTRDPKWTGASKPSCPGFSYSSKDYFSLKTKLCSTNFTQNADLLELLQWVTKLRQVAEDVLKDQPNIDREGLVSHLLKTLHEILVKVTKVDGEEIVKFLRPILDALFLILVDPIEQISTELRSGSDRSSYRDLLTIGGCGIPANNKNTNGEIKDNKTPPPHSRSVFDCLLYIFGLILDHKFQNFQKVINLYIEEEFSSTLAYKKLAEELQYSITNNDADKVLKVMKSIEFFFKFIIKSFTINKRLRFLEFGLTDQDRCEDEDFEKTIASLFEAMTLLIRRNEGDRIIGAQGGCFKHIPSIIKELIKVYPARRLSEHLIEFCRPVKPKRLSGVKLTFISEIVHSPLFINEDCRSNLLPTISQNILMHLPCNDEELRRRSMENAELVKSKKLRKFFGADSPGSNGLGPLDNDVGSLLGSPGKTHSEEVYHLYSHPLNIKCVLSMLRSVPPNKPPHEILAKVHTEKAIELLGDMMDILHDLPEDKKMRDVSYIMLILLRPIIFSIGTITSNDPLAGNMVGIFLSLLREMKTYHYEILINDLKGEKSASSSDPYKHALLKFLNDVLVVMKNLFHTSYFPLDWNAMILLQNSVVLGALGQFSSTIKAEFGEPFEQQPWDNFFICSVSFLTQPSLQLESFSRSKINYIVGNYGDMRKSAAKIIHQMWFSLGGSKRIKFVPHIVGIFLDMALVPEAELRRTTIPIFFDMMHCEFDQDRPIKSFKEVEDELIKKMVEGLEGGKGDFGFREIFRERMSSLCNHNSTGLREQGLSMVSTLTHLIDLLLQYREVIHEEDPSNRMSCIVNLLDFSKEINRKELYLRYLYKLHHLQLKWENFTEAAFALKLHARQLEWSDEELSPLLRDLTTHPSLTTQAELKEALYNDIIRFFNSAKMWECALEVCDELRQQYEDSWNYAKLPGLHRQIATFYGKILDEPRFKPEYFRVGFYGEGFPTFLQDKVFVYRGRQFEQLPVFEGRMLGRYMQAELLRNLGPPSDEIRYSKKQYLQICKVDPVQTDNKRLSGMKNASENIKNYYRSNEIEKFVYSRPYHEEPRDPDNEFASLWLDRYTLFTSQPFPGIMSWFPVCRQINTKIRPIENAIETLQNANDTLRKLVIAHCSNPDLDLGELSMKLNGILDAAVMGGVANYEKAFLKNEEYLQKNPDDGRIIENLKKLIFLQIPIIEECLKIHERKSAPSMIAFHKRLDELFRQYVSRMESTYNVNIKDIRDEGLLREMQQVLKIQESKHHQTSNQLKNEGQVGHRSSTVTLGRISNFQSTSNIYYQNANGHKRSMGPSSARSGHMFRRSTHNSFSGSVEGEQLTSSSATLPRNNNAHSHSKLPPLESNENNASDSCIHLTQTLVTQRPRRQEREERKRESCGDSIGRERLSELSHDTLRTTPISEPSSRNSVNSPDSAIGVDEAAPPLPPKLRVPTEGGPPPPPPKKPPLRTLLDS